MIIRVSSLFILLLSLAGFAQEFSQWRGPERNGHFPDKHLLKQWPGDGPEKLWSLDGLGEGYSSATAGSGVIYTTGKIDSLEVLSAIDTGGKLLWQLGYGRAAQNNGYPAARTTPAVSDGKIYLISGMGEVVCVDAVQQRVAWTVDGYTRFAGIKGVWEVAESPLVVDGKVIYTPAGHKTTMIALDKKSGETVWTSESLHDTSAYASPVLVEYAGKKMLVTVTARHVLALNAADGSTLWTFNYFAQDAPDHPMAPFINCNAPVYHNGRIFVTSGYNHTGLQLQLNPDGTAVEMLWKAPQLDTHIGGVVLVNGHLYGSNWINNRNGNWVCLDWETGALRYEESWNNKGSIVAADGMLYCYVEGDGKVALVKPNPQAFEVVSSFTVEEGAGPHWAHPTIHNGILYIRHGSVLLAYNVKAAG